VKDRQYFVDIGFDSVPIYGRTEGNIETVCPYFYVLTDAVNDFRSGASQCPQTLSRRESLQFFAGDSGPRLISAHMEVQVDTAQKSRWIALQLLAGPLDPLMVLLELFR